LQILRIRNAVVHIVGSPQTFRISDYGYYDYSHFYKHLKTFLNPHTIALLQPRLRQLHDGSAA
jgi:hypothetical protein